MTFEKYLTCIGELTKTWFDHQNRDDLHARFIENFSWTLYSDENLEEGNSSQSDELEEKLNTNEYAIIRALSFGLSEIEYCLDTLSDVQIYMRRFPYSGTQITKTNHLRRCIEMYLEEIYILKERLVNYVEDIKGHTEISKFLPEEAIILLDKAKSIAIEGLQPITGYGQLRGKHIHETRFSNPDIERLSSLEHLADLSNMEREFSDLFLSVRNLEFIKIRQEWVGRTKKEVDVIMTIIDSYFMCLHVALFVDDCAPRFDFYTLDN